MDQAMKMPGSESDREFRRRIARFELHKARSLAGQGRPQRAAIALARARLWRWDPLLRSQAGAQPHGLEVLA